MRAFVMVGMFVDFKDMNRISKKIINKKETRIIMKDPEREYICCGSCGYRDRWSKE